ncbi:MAG: ATP-grasp domain-containing protein [Myxococcota bacterium]
MHSRPMIVLLFGGQNAEKNVSVASAQNLLSALPSDCETLLLFWRPDATVRPVTAQQLRDHASPYVTPFQPQLLSASEYGDLSLDQAMRQLAHQARSQNKQVIILLGVHGVECEDGKLQRLLEQEGLAFTGSDSRVSALAFDKIQAKQRVQQHGIVTAEHLLLDPAARHTWQNLAQQFLCKHGALVMKPVQEGSSTGLQFLDTDEEVVCAMQAAAKVPRPTLLEPKLSGIELAVGVLQDETGRVTALPCTQVKPQAGRCFDYAGKYLGEGVQEITPAQVPDELAKQAQAMAVQAHKAVGCRGYSRTDCIATSAGIVFLEINTLPGLSPNSFIPQQLRAAGMSLRQFVTTQLNIAQQAVCAHKQTSDQAVAG